MSVQTLSVSRASLTTATETKTASGTSRAASFLPRLRSIFCAAAMISASNIVANRSSLFWYLCVRTSPRFFQLPVSLNLYLNDIGVPRIRRSQISLTNVGLLPLRVETGLSALSNISAAQNGICPLNEMAGFRQRYSAIKRRECGASGFVGCLL